MFVTKCARVVIRQLCCIMCFLLQNHVFRLPFSGRYAMVALRKVNFNQIPKIIPKIPVSIVNSVLWKNIASLKKIRAWMLMSL